MNPRVSVLPDGRTWRQVVEEAVLGAPIPQYAKDCSCRWSKCAVGEVRERVPSRKLTTAIYSAGIDFAGAVMRAMWAQADGNAESRSRHLALALECLDKIDKGFEELTGEAGVTR